MARSQVCSTSTNYVTLPSMWPPRGLNLPSCLKVKSYLCHPSKSCIYTTSYLRAIHTATKKHNIITYFGLLSFSIVNRLKAILLSMDASYVNYLTVPLQRYSLHSFLLSHWEGLLVLALLTPTLFALLNLGSWCLELAPRNPNRERKYKAVWYIKLKLLSGKLWVWVNEFISPDVNCQLLLK